jgi:zinc transporter 1/2/3
MLPPAYSMLTSSCLADPWLAYPAFFGLFAMLGLLATQGVQTVLVSVLYRATSPTPAKLEEGEAADAKPADKVFVVEKADETDSSSAVVHAGHSHGHAHSSSHLHASIYALEFGVAAHSVVIGMALGTASGESFLPLMIALIFHQLFEGIALGATVADAGFKTSRTWITG